MMNSCVYIPDSMAEDFADKLNLAGHLLFGNLEFDWSFAGRPFDQLSGDENERCRCLLLETNKKIVLLNCPVPPADQAAYRQILRQAYWLGVENICVPAASAGDLEAIRNISRMGRPYDIGIVIEPKGESELGDVQALRSLFRALGNDTGLIFNPLTYVRQQMHPFFHVFYQSNFKNQIRFLRVNDGLYHDGSPVGLTEGNAEIKELASILLSRSFKGYFALSPYLPDLTLPEYEALIGCFRHLLQTL
ncbi:MAG: hypothetical protein VB070_04155 [Clostridiaceae bacterium]|nr:hypothetical protein [Clostridiaceae bacterium]